LETLEEIAIRGKESFIESWRRIVHGYPCLNTNLKWVELLLGIAINLKATIKIYGKVSVFTQE